MPHPHHAAGESIVRQHAESLDQITQLKAGLEAALRVRTATGLSPTEVDVILELMRRPNLIGAELAENTNSQPSHVTRTVQKLVERGLLETSDKSGRRIAFQLTPKGAAIAQEIEGEQLERLRPILHELRPNLELDALLKLTTASVRKPPSGDSIQIRAADTADLRWLVGQMPTKFRHDLYVTGRRCGELYAHSQLATDEEGAWLATNWSMPVGGCTLTPDPKSEGGAVIGLLYVDSHLIEQVARPLLERAVDAAEAFPYATLRTAPLSDDPAMAAALRWVGFYPKDKMKLVSKSKLLTLDVWERAMPVYRPLAGTGLEGKL